MGSSFYLLPLLVLLILLNYVPWRVLGWHVHHWVAEERQRHTRRWIAAFILLLNLPLVFFFIRPLDRLLWFFPTELMPAAFLPAAAWVLTLLLYGMAVAGISVGWMLLHKWRAQRAGSPSLLAASSAAPAPKLGLTRAAVPSSIRSVRENDAPAATYLLARRRFLAGGMGLAVPAFFGVSTYGLRGALDGLEISPELPVAIPHLTRALEGLRIVQISDIHVGPYLRRRELESAVARVNALRPDLVVITGDLLDRDMESLPDALAGLRGLRASGLDGRGVFMVLGNHDLYADPAEPGQQGGRQITAAVRAMGIGMLRDETVVLGAGDERLAVLGLDWIDPRRGPSYLFYDAPRTAAALAAMNAGLAPETPRILLAHHPETFTEAQPHSIGLTLAGHTHGGGQIVLGQLGGQPVGVSALRFHYRSGLYQQAGMSLYVNRGLGYMGLPIRINCPSEISQFRLTRA